MDDINILCNNQNELKGYLILHNICDGWLIILCVVINIKAGAG